MKWYHRTRIQDLYQALENGVLLSDFEKMRRAPGGKRRIKEMQSIGGEKASYFQNLHFYALGATLVRSFDGEVMLCFELDQHKDNSVVLKLPSVALEKMVAVAVSKKHFEGVQRDFKNGYGRRYEKVSVEMMPNSSL